LFDYSSPIGCQSEQQRTAETQQKDSQDQTNRHKQMLRNTDQSRMYKHQYYDYKNCQKQRETRTDQPGTPRMERRPVLSLLRLFR
jgi:hypothetical protein